MTTQDQTYDTPIKVDASNTVYVTDDTAGVIRDELNAQGERWLHEAKALWDDCDVESLDDIQAVTYKIGRFRDVLSALLYLAVVPEDDEGD